MNELNSRAHMLTQFDRDDIET